MRTGIFVIAAMLTAGTAASQPRVARGEQGGPFSFFETANFPASDPHLSRIDLLYRIDRNFFIAIRNSDTSFPYGFIRRGEISVELVDSTGVSRARRDERISLGEENEQPRDPVRKSWCQGILSLEVAPGKYTVVLEVTDLESKRDFIDRERTVRAAAFGTKPLELSTPLFLEGNPPATVPDTLSAANYGSDFLWSSTGMLFLMLSGTSLADSACDVQYTISLAQRSSEAPTAIAREHLHAVVPIRGLDALPLNRGEDVGYRFLKKEGLPVACLFFGFHSDTLLLRDYQLDLEVTQGNQKATGVKRFRMVWPDMPVSLRNVDHALEALRFITTEGRLDSLKSGDYETRRGNLEGFWKSIDLASAGPRNAAMIQYYERVDHAGRHFGTLRQPDGTKSDRGRIFILYGPPTRTERTLDPTTGFTEVWTYERANRKFTFRDQTKTGDYSLIATTSP